MLRKSATTFVDIDAACSRTVAPYFHRYPPTAGLGMRSCHTFGCSAPSCSCAVWHICFIPCEPVGVLGVLLCDMGTRHHGYLAVERPAPISGNNQIPRNP